MTAASKQVLHAGYAELQVATNFSFLEGGSHPYELVVRAAELGLAAIAVTDRNSVAGLVRAHLAARELGLKLVAGCRLSFQDGTPDLLCYPQDRAAYGRLCRLLTRGKSNRVTAAAPATNSPVPAASTPLEIEGASLRLPSPRRRGSVINTRYCSRSTMDSRLRGNDGGGASERPRADFQLSQMLLREDCAPPSKDIPKGECQLRLSDFLDYAEGQIIAVLPPPGLFGDKAQAQHFEARLQILADRLKGRVYLAASCRFQGDDAKTLHRLAGLAKAHSARLLAVNGVLYHDPSRRRLQDVLVCIRETCTIDEAGFRLAGNAERHLKSPAEMARLFAKYPEAIANTLELSRRCTFSLQELAYEYPDEIAPNGEDPQTRLERLTWEGFTRRYPASRYPEGPPQAVADQIRHEFELIARLKYAPFFLTVEDVVRFARSANILHQGRGSAANSAVCYALGITEVDPARSNLLFERFISDARDEPPDIDVDFEHERREEVIQYIYRRYGRHRAGLCATVICYRTRGAVREVGKALGLSPDVTAALAGSTWGWSEDGIAEDTLPGLGLDASDARLALCLELSRQLIGFPRHLSQHPGGFLIARGRLDELVPIENAAMDERTVISWDKDDIEALGMLKVDVLALGMLTCLAKGFDLLRQRYGRDLTPATVPAEDPAVYEMLSRADSIGVFQVESRAQQTMLPRLKPACFYDLVVEVAIVRPGPIQGDMVHPYLRRRQGLEPATYPSPELKNILEKTLGVPLFQEQCMKIAIVAAGFKPGRADELRRAMATFKKVGTIGGFKDEFIGGMIARNYDRSFAERCFSQIQGFGTYGFPESHAASFALLVYCSAWMKCYYPDVFLAALLNSQPMGFYAPAQLVRDAREHGVEVRPVDVNASTWDHTLEPPASVSSQGNIAVSVETPPCITRGDGSSGSETAEKIPDRPKGAFRDNGGGSVTALSPRHDGSCGKYAVRLGLRLVAGLSEKDGKAIADARIAGGLFESPEDAMRRANLRPAAMLTLARADAFGSLDLSRRTSLWDVCGLEADELPLLPSPGTRPVVPFAQPISALDRRGEPGHDGNGLPPMREEQTVAEDYAVFGLSLRNHPMAFMRGTLKAERAVTAAGLKTLPNGRKVKIAGLVLFRQRPGTAKGTIFVTIEDETGAANLIVWPKVSETYRRAVFGAKVLMCEGVLQKESNVIHVVSRKLTDWTFMLRGMQPGGEAFAVRYGRGDEVAHASAGDRRTSKPDPENWTGTLKSRDFR